MEALLKILRAQELTRRRDIMSWNGLNPKPFESPSVPPAQGITALQRPNEICKCAANHTWDSSRPVRRIADNGDFVSPLIVVRA